MAKVIGICGEIGAGKGEVAKRLSEALGLPEYAYAQGVKDIVHTIGYTDHFVTRDTKELEQRFDCSVAGIMEGVRKVFPKLEEAQRVLLAGQLLVLIQQGNFGFKWVRLQEGVLFSLHTSYRKLYQLVGTDWGRKLIDPNVWINLRPKECVVNDVRAFEGANDPYAEAKAIIADGGLVIGVINPKTTGKDFSNGHSSEYPMSEEYIHCFIANYSTLEDLYTEVDELAEYLIEYFSTKVKSPNVGNKKPKKPEKLKKLYKR